MEDELTVFLYIASGSYCPLFNSNRAAEDMMEKKKENTTTYLSLNMFYINYLSGGDAKNPPGPGFFISKLCQC